MASKLWAALPGFGEDGDGGAIDEVGAHQPQLVDVMDEEGLGLVASQPVRAVDDKQQGLAEATLVDRPGNPTHQGVEGVSQLGEGVLNGQPDLFLVE